MALSRKSSLALALLGLLLTLAQCRPSADSGAKSAASAGPKGPPVAFDPAAIDRSADPCTDFYQYACGAWIKNNPIPADRGAYGRWSELEENNLAILHDILEKAASPDPARSPDMQKIGDYYAACMDEKVVEAKGAAPLKPDLDAISGLESKADLAVLAARLQLYGVNTVPGDSSIPSLFFSFESEQDFKDATSQIAAIDQGGLGLPDRDYYLKEDPKSAETRDTYVAHVRKTFELLGDPPEAAAASAAKVMAIETTLAKSSLDKVTRRDPKNLYHKMSRQQFAALTPSFAWDRYFEAAGAPPIRTLNVRVPEFFRGLEHLIQSVPLDDWKSYLRWHLARAWSTSLSSAFVNEHFEFYSKTLAGQKELKPRWKRCVAFTDGGLGEALGKPFVAVTLGLEGKQRTLKMVQAIEKALEEDIASIPWMTEATKTRALEKLRAITNKIGYPDTWRDYGGVTIATDDFIGDTRRCRVLEFRRWLDKIGKPVDPSEWHMTPPTVNAYYDPQMNNINFPAGILQPPFYGNRADDAVNFGGVGMVVGHELTHGFDDSGRQFDARGNLRDWWTPQDAREFEKRAACFVDEYSSFTAVGDVKLNGKLTLGENVADNGGLRLASMALQSALAEASRDGGTGGAGNDGGAAKLIDGFTPQQRLFIANAQIWCANISDELSRLIAQTNPHSLYKYRVNGVVSNMPEFQQAFACPAGSPMVRKDACRIW